MTDYILLAFILVCMFYTVTRAVSRIVDMVTVKFFVNDDMMENVVSRLISLTSLRWDGIRDDRSYTVTTKGYVVTVKKNKNKDK